MTDPIKDMTIEEAIEWIRTVDVSALTPAQAVLFGRLLQEHVGKFRSVVRVKKGKYARQATWLLRTLLGGAETAIDEWADRMENDHGGGDGVG